jgi:hypothetical protein
LASIPDTSSQSADAVHCSLKYKLRRRKSQFFIMEASMGIELVWALRKKSRFEAM